LTRHWGHWPRQLSLLDLDARTVEIAAQCDVIYGPLVDAKIVPEGIFLTLIEGAVSGDHDSNLAVALRANSKLLVAFGDCAVTGNVPSMHFRGREGGPIRGGTVRSDFARVGRSAQRVTHRHSSFVR